MKKDIREIILFGSYARGEAHRYSDIDVCVIVTKKTPALKRLLAEISEKAMSLDDYQDLLSLKIEDEGSWQHMRQGHYPLAQNIQREGVDLWPPKT